MAQDLSRMAPLSDSAAAEEGLAVTAPAVEGGADTGALHSLLQRWFSEDSWIFSQAFLIQNWQWIGLLFVLTVGVFAERTISFILRRGARRMATSRRLNLSEKRLTGFVRPFGVMVVWWTFVTLLPLLQIANEAVERVLDLAASLLLTAATVVAALRLTDLLCDLVREKARTTQNKFDDMLVPLMRRTVKIFIIVVGIAYVGSVWTEDFWKVITGLSIGTAVLAFAFKDSLENVFGTFTVLLDKPFQLGDWITVESVDGTVESVGFRSTRVRTFYNSIITVPNRQFISAQIDNWGARRYRRIRQTLGLQYDTPPEKIEAFCEGVRELIRLHPYTRKDYYHVYLNSFGASSLDVLLYCFVETPDWAMELRERHRLMADILRLAEKLGVAFAFPSTSVYMVDPESLEHPDRPESDPAGAKLGRGVAAEVAEASLAPFGKNRPGPVKFVQANSPLAAPGGDGA